MSELLGFLVSKPEAPEIVLKIDFEDGKSDAAHVFQLATDLIRSLEGMDRLLCRSFDTSVRVSLVVEDLNKSSIRVTLKNIIEEIPDEAISELSVKKVVGHFLLKGKKRIIKFLEEGEKSEEDLKLLTREIHEDARETEILLLPHYQELDNASLIQEMDKFQKIKRNLSESEDIQIAFSGQNVPVNKDSDWIPSEVLTVDEPDPFVDEQEVVLVIAKPDMQGGPRWTFRKDKSNNTIEICDQPWLKKFISDRTSLAPGDALRVRLKAIQKFDEFGRQTKAEAKIIRVLEIVRSGVGGEADLFGGT